ncbi:MAG: hypothetical protein KBC41_03470 [Candidatus Pacebacteria bacterium]|nr:hypothetical protein [Candidatus Paceibacterota bacterium]MBP9867106.1 hypothetical protein [Candidatus Paceibacterota bacterium]
MFRSTKTLVIYVSLLIAIGMLYTFFSHVEKEYESITTFKECVEAGYPILEKYPEECKIPGKVFVNGEQIKEDTQKEVPMLTEVHMNPKNTSYTIEGKEIYLKDGEFLDTDYAFLYFGKELRLDLDGNTKEDSAFILTASSTSSSEVLYYLVVALSKDGDYRGTNGVLLGENITPISTEFKNNAIFVTYTEKEKQNKQVVIKEISRSFSITESTLVELSQ